MASKNNTRKIDQDTQVAAINREREEELTQEGARTLNLPYVDLRMSGIHYETLALVKEKEARRAKLAVIQKKGRELHVAVENPQNPETIEILEKLKKEYDIIVAMASRSSLEEVWGRYPKGGAEGRQITGAIKIASQELEGFQAYIKSKTDLQAALNARTETNASQVFEVIMGGALRMKASDVHIEPREGGATIRMRIDGILYGVARIDEHLYALVLSRIKLLSSLKLNIHDAPQEGRFSIELEERTIEMRTSILPNEYGEEIALRILDPQFLLSLKELGVRPDLEKSIEERLGVPEGLILTTGPTGSGKTTTLYAFINFLKSTKIKIVTIEDPIEYHLGGISQTQIALNEEYTFARGLRAILRQDPDVVLISELRDVEAAEAALGAALAGRRVLSTLHTNDAAGAVPRLIDMGIGPTTIASALSIIIAQRLVRRLCPVCRVGHPGEKNYEKISSALEGLPSSFKIPKFSAKTKIYQTKKGGCSQCNNTGYQGRIGVFEVIVSDKEIRKKISEGPTEDEFKNFVVRGGMITMKQDALLKVLEGVTSMEEVGRVLGKL